MKLSTRVRYGVRLMISLAEKFGTGPMYLKDIAAEQEISEKYLSLIVLPLRSAGLVISSRGAHGGYTLARDPKKISLKEIVDTLEGESCLVDCVREPSSCSRTAICPTRDIWLTVGERISETLDETTLDQLAASSRQKKQAIAEDK
ncbi:MAG: Rrf2 family transcriptional regulator [Syntrophales bacterium]|nr:Rrf2 family transcriptional regulator [Syntrophales bacterium]